MNIESCESAGDSSRTRSLSVEPFAAPVGKHRALTSPHASQPTCRGDRKVNRRPWISSWITGSVPHSDPSRQGSQRFCGALQGVAMKMRKVDFGVPAQRLEELARISAGGLLRAAANVHGAKPLEGDVGAFR